MRLIYAIIAVAAFKTFWTLLDMKENIRKAGRQMNKLNPKPIDIINAAIAEIYGERAVELLSLASGLNDTGWEHLITYAHYNSLNHKKAIRFSDVNKSKKTETK